VNLSKEIIGSVADHLPSHAGVQFEEYVKELELPTVYNSTGSCSLVISSSWPGRRLKLLPTPEGVWIKAKVVAWRRYCAGPLSSSTLWYLYLTIEFEYEQTTKNAFAPGDLLQVHGLGGVVATTGI
jgi:hypothetical protein